MSALLFSGCPENKSEAPVEQALSEVNVTQGINLQGINLQGINLQGINLQGINLQGINLQGINLQGINLQGLNLQGLNLQGLNLQGINLQGLNLQGVTLTTIAFDGSLLMGLLSDGRVISGTDFIGTEIIISVTSPTVTSYTIRIDNVVQDTLHQFTDVWLYTISSKENVKKATYQNICHDSTGDYDVVPLVGMYWDETTGARIDQPNVLTLGCTSGVIAKCARVGYRPWATATSCPPKQSCTTLPLKDHHQSCTRMFRADYCGNGQTFTKNGTMIDVFDYLTPPLAAAETSWPIEAAWSPSGASCLNRPRHPELGFPGYCVNSSGKQVSIPKCPIDITKSGLTADAFNFPN